MVEPIPVHVFASIAASEGQRARIFGGSNSIMLTRGCFLKIDGATVDDHKRIVDAINNVCTEIEAVSNHGAEA